MKVRTTIAGTGLSAMLTVLGCGTMAIFVSAAVSACTGSSSSTPDAGSTFSSAATSPNPGITTETVTASASAHAASNPTASPVTAAPATGGGGTAGTEDVPLFIIGGVAVLAGAGSLAYRRKVARNR
jgi:LPXTG-motif cell wall-anchored protein